MMQSNHATEFFGIGDVQEGTTRNRADEAISGAADKTLSAFTLTNAGSIIWAGGNLVASFNNGPVVSIINQAGALFDVQSDANLSTIYDQYGAATFSNAGTLRKSAGSGTTNIGGDLAFTNTGIVEVLQGTLNFTSAFAQSTGAITLVGGALAFSQPLRLNGGELSGSGTFGGSIENTGGVVRPGNGIGTLTVNGAYIQSGSGTLVLEIGGSTPGTQHDRFVVTGQATLGGAVEAQLLNGYQPALGQSFTPMSFGSHSGMFLFLNTPDWGDDLTFNTGWATTTLSLGVVRTAFGAWKQTKFGANASDPAIAGPLADPNHNGTPNLLEFAFGMEPLIASQTEKLPGTIKVTVNTEDYLAIRFRRLTGASPGVTYSVLESTNHTNWLPVNFQTCQVGTPMSNGDGTETVTVRSTMPMHGAASPGRAFLRVEVKAD